MNFVFFDKDTFFYQNHIADAAILAITADQISTKGSHGRLQNTLKKYV